MDDDSFEFNFWPAFSDFMVSLVLILSVIIGLLSVKLPEKPPAQRPTTKPPTGPKLPPGKTLDEFLFEKLSNKVLEAQKVMPPRLKALGHSSAGSIVFNLMQFNSAADLRVISQSPPDC